METKTYINNFWSLYELSWSGAKDTLDTIIECDKQEEFFDWLCNYFAEAGEIPEQTEVNDFIWFERDYIAEALGYNSFEQMMEEEEE